MSFQSYPGYLICSNKLFCNRCGLKADMWARIFMVSSILRSEFICSIREPAVGMGDERSRKRVCLPPREFSQVVSLLSTERPTSYKLGFDSFG
mgnify:CR=1 FL=1